MECFGGAVKNSLLEVFDESFLLLTLSCLFPLLSGSQLGDKIESLFFAFEHHVLLSASSNQPLQKDNGLLFLISALVLLKVFGPDDLSVRRSFWSDLNFAEEVIFLVLVVLDFLLLDSLIDGQLSPLKCSNMHVLLASHALFELEFNGVDTHALLKDFIWQSAREFLKALISRECFWLHLVFVGLLIKREAISCNGGVDCRTEIGVVFDDVTSLALNLDVLSCFVHFTQHLDALALNLSK